MNFCRLLTIGIMALLSCATANAMRADSLMLERMFHYAQAIQNKKNAINDNYNYTRLSLDIKKKNFTLLAIPSMYAVARTGQRAFIAETYNRVSGYGTDDMQTKTILRNTTIPHRREVMEIMLKYLTPKIYQETIIEDYLISPFARINKRFYRYKVTFLSDDIAEVTFTPRRKNTQLVTGYAIVDFYTGHIKECYIDGEYDMVDFGLQLTMGDEYRHSLLPSKLILDADFSFAGNKINSRYVSYYDLQQYDSISKPGQMASLRPDSLSLREQELIAQFVAAKPSADSTTTKKSTKFWEAVGDHTLNRIRQNIGNRGYIRISPILNPLYFGYSPSRGITYKFDIRASYMFSANSEVSTRFKAGYTFKQKRLYMHIPTTWYFDKKRNGYARLELGNGSHVGNSLLVKHIEEQLPDTVIDWSRSTLNDFTNNYMKLYANLSLNDYINLKGGMTMHRRKAVDHTEYQRLGQRYTYHSTAPTMEIQWKPWAMSGPIITADYERSIKGFMQSNLDYERWELNGEYLYRQNKLQSLHLRLGTGFYTSKDRNGYFLDFENFRENTMPGGWNDDWSGEFELLKQEYYNKSDYYIRANISYESPLLALSWLPWAGKYIEMERIHVSTLDVKDIHPYIESGYGFTTRWFSFGFFAAMKQWKFDSVGIKWGFELFRKW